MVKRNGVFVILVLLVGTLIVVGSPRSSYSFPSHHAAVLRLQKDSQTSVDITWDQQTNTASFILGRIPVQVLGFQNNASAEEVAVAFLNQYEDLFGFDSQHPELYASDVVVDNLGMTHVTMNQSYAGIPVYHANARVHLDAQNEAVLAASSSLIPDIQVHAVAPAISATQVTEKLLNAIPNGTLVAEPELVLYPSKHATEPARLAWIVSIADMQIPINNEYVIDAINWEILDVLDKLYTESFGRSGGVSNQETDELVFLSTAQQTGNENLVQTYDALHKSKLPGQLVRMGNDGVSGDRDTDEAHLFTLETYDYFNNTHERSSFDGQGSEMISTVHYRRNYQNAFWNGQQTVYGDRIVAKDVVAHEWTHAVTAHSAKLEYRWQSGALNEGFSDIFGAMVDRKDDWWLIGEDLPFDILDGRDALRNMKEPRRFDQPEHTSEWVKTCQDNEGVHTNSGIINKAYYLIATDKLVGKDKAERIFFRALTTYLDETSSMEDARAAALAAARDLYDDPYDPGTIQAISKRFAEVGLDGEWAPNKNNCGCSASVSMANKSIFSDSLETLDVAMTLYRIRDEKFKSTEGGNHYLSLYEQHTGRISTLLLTNPTLRDKSGFLLNEIAPGLKELVDTNAFEKQVITEKNVADLQSFLNDLVLADTTSGDGSLAEAIDKELQRKDLDKLVGMTYDEAWNYLSAYNQTIYLPVIVR